MIRRGQIWWVDLAEPIGSEPGFRHPALVIQRDEVNQSRIRTVVVCILTFTGWKGWDMVYRGRVGIADAPEQTQGGSQQRRAA